MGKTEQKKSLQKENVIVGFDVSNNSCMVAISAGQEILAYKEDLRLSMQAESLLVLLEKALNFAKLSYSDIDYLAFTNGPGSFTGIRIGMAAAEGILMASPNIKAIPISNFEMSHYRLCRQIKYFDQAIILLNAYRGQLYYQEFDFKSNKGPYGIIDIDKALDLFTKYKDKKISCAGSGLSEIYDKIKDLPNVTTLPRFKQIKATLICRYADDKINRGDLIDKIEPLYIRPPDAKLPA